MAESETVTAEKIPNNLPRLERAMKLNLLSVIKQLLFFPPLLFNAILYPHDCVATGARLYTHTKTNSVAVRSCTECANRVLAGDVRSTAGEAHS